MITYNPHQRIGARAALDHPYFKELRDSNENKENYDAKNIATSAHNVKQKQDDDVTMVALKDSTNDDPLKRLKYSHDQDPVGDFK